MALTSHVARLTTQAGPNFGGEIILVHACAMILDMPVKVSWQ